MRTIRQYQMVPKAFVSALCGLLLVLSAQSSRAQTLPISLSPTRFEFGAYPGDTLSGTIEFWNGTDGGLAVFVEPEDFLPQDDEGHVTLVEGDDAPSRSLKSWLTPVIPAVTIYPKQKIKLDFDIAIPDGATPGTYWGALAVRTMAGEGGNGAAIEARLGTIILLQVYGEAQESLTLEEFSAPRFLQGSAITLRARFRNDGTVHEKPHGIVHIRDMLGRSVAAIPIPERTVLPGYARRTDVAVSDGLVIGRYTAILEASYGSSDNSLRAEAAFWVVPWKTYGPMILGSACLIWFVIARRKNFKDAFHVLRTGEEAQYS